jgi:hypothetical protein
MLFFPFAVFHGVHSYYTILRIFAEEHYGHGRGVEEAAGECWGMRSTSRRLSAWALPGRGRNSTPCPSLPPASFLSFLVLPVHLTDGGRRGGELVGEEPNHTSTRKPGPL